MFFIINEAGAYPVFPNFDMVTSGCQATVLFSLWVQMTFFNMKNNEDVISVSDRGKNRSKFGLNELDSSGLAKQRGN